MELIPAIDIISGQCVRLTKGDYGQKTVYDTDPVSVARRLERSGFRHLHVVDLDGARSRHVCNDHILRQITAETNLSVDFGGGIKTDEDIEKAFASGASMVNVGSIAATDPALFRSWIDRYGPSRIILGADVRNGRVAVNGWKNDSGEELLPFLKRYIDYGISRVVCTDISRDGTLSGPSIDLYRQIKAAFPTLSLIASGGVAGNEDFSKLQAAGVSGVIFGKALYEGRINVSALMASYPQESRGLAKRIIPCLDVKDGMTVKGTNFLNLRKAGDPVELGKLYSREGADELVFLDITASLEGRKTFTEMVTRVAREINIPFTVGGGINELRDVERLLSAGADKVSLNSAAISRPQLISEIASKFGSQVCVCAIDARLENGQWLCYAKGGSQPTGLRLMDWACEAQERGAGEILFTSMNNDGVKGGFSCEALAELSSSLSIPVIASGGAGSMEHFRDAFTHGKADATLAASVFHFGEIRIPELKKYLRREGINVRL